MYKDCSVMESLAANAKLYQLSYKQMGNQQTLTAFPGPQASMYV